MFSGISFKARDCRFRKSEQESREGQPVGNNVGPRVGHRDGKHQKPEGRAKKSRGARRGNKACDHGTAGDG